jgi:hypothetical protein
VRTSPKRRGLAVAAAVCLGGCTLAISAWAKPTLSGRHVPEEARQVLLEILEAAKLETAEVTSTTRTVEEQAEVMFNYINKNGYDDALELYGPHGDSIIEVCKASYAKHKNCTSDILPKMVDETRRQVALLEKQGDKRRELMHTSDSHYTIDIRPESLENRAAFAVAVEKHPKVSRFLRPPRDRNSYHLEIPRSPAAE